MRSFFLLLTLLWIYLPSVRAQNTGKITGRINVNSEKAVDPKTFTISLLQPKDSVAIKNTTANKEGVFQFENVALGKYTIVITGVGFQKKQSPVIEITSEKSSIQLPAIQLVQQSKTMTGVTVTAQRPPVEHKIDRTVVNVEASVTNVGATALEVLEKSPGITVDKDGNISLKGKDGVMVLIDGRPTQLGGADLANMLRSMNASQMDQIEIMTNPPARYDAAGNAGVINIKTKRSKAVGYNGSVTLGYTQGRYPKTNESANFSYKEGKVAVFTNFNHGYRENFNVLSIQRNLRNNTTKELENYFDQRANMIMDGQSYNGKIGIDYFITKKTTIGAVVNGFTSNNNMFNRNVTNISAPSKELQSVTKATVDNGSQWKNFSTNFNIRRTFDSAGRELTADLDYMTYDSENDQLMINSYFDASGTSMQKADSLQGALPQNIKIYSGRIDYVHPLKKGAKFEAGAKSSIVRTDNNAIYDSIQNGAMVHDFNRSNHFVYEENINAAYVNYSKPLSKKISSQLGLRFEQTSAKGTQLTTGEQFDRQYAQLFPTAYFQYKANAKNNFGINYGRRIRRPNYESLNPFIRFIDSYTSSQGNPNLKPQLSNQIELSHTYKNFFTTTLNYSKANDIIQMVIEQKGQEAYAKQANIASLQQFGLAISVNNNPTKWWTNSFYINAFNNRFEGMVNNAFVAISATTFSLNGSQQFKLTKTLTAELNGFYRSASVEGVLRTKPMGMLAAGFSQQIMKTKGGIRVSVRDIFYTQKFSASTKYGNVDAAFQELRDSRTVSVSFSYRFNKGKSISQRKRQSGADEQNRVGVE